MSFDMKMAIFVAVTTMVVLLSLGMISVTA